LFGIVGEKMDNTKIDRINELAHKQKSVGLTEEEKLEQAELRKEYIESIRASLRANLNNISIEEADGSITDLGEKFGKKNE
jgi:5-formyltetrahydrofolate cyclo-ligase